MGERGKKGQGMSDLDSPCGQNGNATYQITQGARGLELSPRTLCRMVEKLRILDIHKTAILFIIIIFKQPLGIMLGGQVSMQVNVIINT